jgi:aspartate-semialdehyde dehydrogenase
MKQSAYSIAVVGATGLVGGEIISVLEQRQLPVGNLGLYASLRSAGDEVRRGDVAARIELLETARFDDTDLVFLAADERVSAEWAGRAAAAGAIVIDTSQLFAGDDDVPLIVPEVNASELAGYASRGLVSSPDSPAIALAVALAPLHSAAVIKRVVASTLEPVSGCGRAGIEELQRQTVELMNGRSVENTMFPHRIAFNILPHVGEFVAGGASRDEVQTVNALRRLLNDTSLPISVTRIRAPIFYGAALSVNIETEARLSAAQAREILRDAPGVLLQDVVAAQQYPTPVDAVGQDATCVGRIRDDLSTNVLDIWIAIDNTRKGSAVNAVQIAELLIRDYL